MLLPLLQQSGNNLMQHLLLCGLLFISACSVRASQVDSDFIVKEFFAADFVEEGVYLVGDGTSYRLPLDILYNDFELGINENRKLGIEDTVLFRLIRGLEGSEDWAFSVLRRLRSSYSLDSNDNIGKEVLSVKVVGVDFGNSFNTGGPARFIRRYDLGIDSEMNYWGLLEVDDRTSGRSSGGVWILKYNLNTSLGLVADRLAIY